MWILGLKVLTTTTTTRELVKTIMVKLKVEAFFVSFLDAIATIEIPRSKQ